MYTRALADEICSRVAGGESVNSVCRTPGYPQAQTVYEWCIADIDGIRERMDEARRCQAQRLADELAELADAKPATRVEEAWLRTRISTRQWIASKLLPRMYGERIQAEQSGKIVVEVRSFAALSGESNDGTTDK